MLCSPFADGLHVVCKKGAGKGLVWRTPTLNQFVGKEAATAVANLPN